MLCLGTFTYAQTEQPITITVWLHGSKVGPNFFFHDFFYHKEGMVNALDYHPRYHARDMAQYLCDADPQTYHMEHFYFWGWSGRLSRQSRKDAAYDLYQALLTLVHRYEETYPDRVLRLRLIAHSHGGNVLLNLAVVQDQKQLAIDELILLSCPVQYATRDYVTSPYFKKIYSFYSSDLYQIIDFQYTCKNGRYLKRHSDRRFKEAPQVRQVKIKLNNRFLMHVEFLLKRFLKRVPLLCREVDDFYDTLAERDIHKEKLINLHTCSHGTRVMRKIFT
jgi:hypothetical protein